VRYEELDFVMMMSMQDEHSQDLRGGPKHWQRRSFFFGADLLPFPGDRVKSNADAEYFKYVRPSVEVHIAKQHLIKGR
jgi:hypothetical protein